MSRINIGMLAMALMLSAGLNPSYAVFGRTLPRHIYWCERNEVCNADCQAVGFTSGTCVEAPNFGAERRLCLCRGAMPADIQGSTYEPRYTLFLPGGAYLYPTEAKAELGASHL